MKTLMEKLLEGVDTTFNANVEVDLMITDFDGDVVYPKKVMINYDIDIEYRSWGIKDMLFVCTDIVEIPYTLEGEEENILKVDLGKIKVDYSEGSGWYPDTLSIRMRKDGTIEDILLMVRYFKPGY